MQFSKERLYSSVVGILTAIPVYVIQEPIYILPFIVVLYHLVFGRFKSEDRTKLVIFFLLTIVVLLTNLLGTYAGYQSISFSSILYFLMSTFVLAFSYSSIDTESFFTWFLIAAKGAALYVFILFFKDAFLAGAFYDVTQSEGRMWAKGLVLGWPNGFAIITSIAAYLCFVKGEKLWSFLLVLSAMTTFSRMAMIFLLVLFVLQIYSMFRRGTFILVVLGLIIIVLPILLEFYFANEKVLYRIAKYSDRLVIAQNLLDTLIANPFGIGNVNYRDISSGDIYESYHSTFLKVLVRYGFIGFFMFVVLVAPIATMRLFSLRSILVTVLLVLAIPQDFLLLPSVALLYSLVANHRKFLSDKSRTLV